MFKPVSPAQFRQDLSRATKVTFEGPGCQWEADTEHGHRILTDESKDEFVVKKGGEEISRFPIGHVSSIRVQVTTQAQVIWNLEVNGTFVREDPMKSRHPREDSHLDGRRIYRR